MKTPIHILFLIGIAFLTITSCKNVRSNTNSELISEKACVENILKLDDSLGTIRNHACEKISLSETIIQYSDELEKLSFKYCQEDFKIAFKAHENAWRNMIMITDKYPEMRGEMHDLFDQIEVGKDSTEFKERLKAIWDTWKPIETIKNQIK